MHPLLPMRTTFPTHLTFLDLTWSFHTYIWRRVRVGNPLIMQFSRSSSYFLSPLPNILLSTLFSNNLSLCLSLNVRNQVSHRTKLQVKLWVCNFNLYFFAR
jgi:hypothetical protein